MVQVMFSKKKAPQIICLNMLLSVPESPVCIPPFFACPFQPKLIFCNFFSKLFQNILKIYQFIGVRFRYALLCYFCWLNAQYEDCMKALKGHGDFQKKP